MKYYTYFDLPNWEYVTQRALLYYHNAEYLKKMQDDYSESLDFQARFNLADVDDTLKNVPELVEMFASVNLTISKIMFFEANAIPDDRLIHMDGAAKPARFVLPTLNCSRSEIAFYTSNQPLIPAVFKEDTTHKFPVPGSCVEVDRVLIDRPVLIQVNELHRTILPPDNPLPRITLLVDTHEDLMHFLE